MKSKDTKGQRQNHLGSLLGRPNGVPVRDNTVGADNLPLIKGRRGVCRPQEDVCVCVRGGGHQEGVRAFECGAALVEEKMSVGKI